MAGLTVELSRGGGYTRELKLPNMVEVRVTTDTV
jgi:hypothetical protein